MAQLVNSKSEILPQASLAPESTLLIALLGCLNLLLLKIDALWPSFSFPTWPDPPHLR